jgi:hypothetical protein
LIARAESTPCPGKYIRFPLAWRGDVMDGGGMWSASIMEF